MAMQLIATQNDESTCSSSSESENGVIASEDEPPIRPHARDRNQFTDVLRLGKRNDTPELQKDSSEDGRSSTSSRRASSKFEGQISATDDSAGSVPVAATPEESGSSIESPDRTQGKADEGHKSQFLTASRKLKDEIRGSIARGSISAQGQTVAKQAAVSKRFHAGYLSKPSYAMGFVKTWRRRYFRVRADGLLWYTSREHSKAKGELRFTDSTTLAWHDGRPNAIALRDVLLMDRYGVFSPSSEEFVLQADSEQERNQWAAAIRNKIEQLKQSKLHPENVPENMLLPPQPAKASSTMNSKLRQAVHTVIRSSKSEEGRDQAALFEQRYLLGEEIGEGSFSVVRKAMDRRTGAMYAVKCGKPSPTLLQEVAILKQFRHPSLIQLHDFFMCDDICYIVTDYMKDGDLCDKLIADHNFEESAAAKMTACLAEGIRHFHSFNVVHRDIKPENVLMDGEFAKIADFGLAKQLSSKHEMLRKTCGTPEYAAPELLEGAPYGLPCDIFSLGVVTYVMLVGTFPFSVESANALQHLERFADGKDVRNMSCLDPDSPQWGNVSESAKDAVLRMLEPNPEARITAEELVKHPWVAHFNLNADEAAERECGRVRSMLFEGFKTLLKLGITISKHGRRGSPHTTKLILEGDTLKWESRTSRLLITAISSPRGSDTPFSPKIKAGGATISNSLAEDNGSTGIKLANISQVIKGHETDVFKRPDNCSTPACCLSIISGQRTLDIECASAPQADWMFNNLQLLVSQSRQ